MRKIALAVFLATLAQAEAASAAGSYPDEYALRPLQLPASMVQLKVPLDIDLSRGNAGKLLYMPFELRIGVAREVELRIFHPVHGLCLRGCGRAYDDVGFGVLVELLREQGVHLSLLGALEVTSFTEPPVRLDGGVAFKYVHAPISIFLSPYVGIGLNHRPDNGDSINFPVEFAFQLSHPTALFIETGLYSDAHDPGGASGPLGVGINYLASHGVDLGAELKLNKVLGNTDAGSRLLLVYAALRNQ
jgi:hypothetical protein